MKGMINKSIVSGTNAERLAMTSASLDTNFAEFYETDTNNTYIWQGSKWIIAKIGGAQTTEIGANGIARNRFVTVSHNTLPILATSGVASWNAPGVRGIVIESVYLSAGTVALTTTNWRVRYGINSTSDAYSAGILPVSEPAGSATVDTAQVGSFNIMPVFEPAVLDANRVAHIILPTPVFIDILTPITRLDFVHNLGSGVSIQLGIRAVEAL